MTARRSFLARLGAFAAATVAGSRVAGAQPSPVDDLVSEDVTDVVSVLTQQSAEHWFTALHGSRRQVFDAVGIVDGFPLRYVATWSRTMRESYSLAPIDVCPLLVLRSAAIPIAFNDTIWQKYKLGALFNVQDPKTSAPSLRNIYNSTADGDWSQPTAAVSRLTEGGGVVAVCNVATMAQSGRAARAAGLTMTPQEAYQEWAANLLPGCHLAASGVLAVHRAQVAGNCTYCAAV